VKEDEVAEEKKEGLDAEEEENSRKLLRKLTKVRCSCLKGFE